MRKQGANFSWCLVPGPANTQPGKETILQAGRVPFTPVTPFILPHVTASTHFSPRALLNVMTSDASPSSAIYHYQR
ncbi:hypothetical protein RRG08_066991 [Elysia crispata]|uniref:Uncharacterized protein n=1 Tax=Elysia crispata TaxID=231223 RepID=A0AAE0ZA70_9GAST|nr:hypothetical protein RRG08_066991 [Elysia crispata]